MADKNNTVKQKRVTVCVQISTETRAQLIVIADRKDLKFSDVVRAAVNEYVAKENK